MRYVVVVVLSVLSYSYDFAVVLCYYRTFVIESQKSGNPGQEGKLNKKFNKSEYSFGNTLVIVGSFDVLI